MKLVWCPEMASKAYIDGVRALSDHGDGLAGSAAGVAELVSAMAGGWNAQLIVEAPHVSVPSSSCCCPAATSLALAAAARRTGGRYACVLPDEGSAAAYASCSDQAAAGRSTFVVGEADEAMAELEGVDLLVVDARRRDATAVLAAARPGARGMVVVRHGDGKRRGAARRRSRRPWPPARGSFGPYTYRSARASRFFTSASARGRAYRAGAAGARAGGSGTSTTTPARSTSSGGNN